MKEPVCTALLFADRIIVENNGKKGIIGTFSRIFALPFQFKLHPGEFMLRRLMLLANINLP